MNPIKWIFSFFAPTEQKLEEIPLVEPDQEYSDVHTELGLMLAEDIPDSVFTKNLMLYNYGYDRVNKAHKVLYSRYIQEFIV